jgi:hypothetical protein
MRIQFVLVLGLLAVACEKDTPSAPTPAPTAVAVSLPSTLWIGESKQATASAAMSNSSSQAVTSGWRSDNAAVASVTDGGTVTGVSYGSATISVAYSGLQDQQRIQVLPDYPGNWTGTYRITSCAPFPSPFYEYFCNGFAPGTTGNVSFVMTLAGEAVSGQFRAADMQFSSFVVPVQGDGGIVASGTGINHPYQFEARWLMNSVSRAQITGTTRWVRSGSAGLVGGAVIEGVIVSLAK